MSSLCPDPVLLLTKGRGEGTGPGFPARSRAKCQGQGIPVQLRGTSFVADPKGENWV